MTEQEADILIRAINRLVYFYLRRYAEQKKGKVSEPEIRKEMVSLAKDAYFAIKPRHHDHFVAYFSELFFSVPQGLSQEDNSLLCRALRFDTDYVKSLTLINLSGQTYHKEEEPS